MASKATLELGGPQPISQLDAIREFQEVGLCGYPIEYIPLELLEKQFHSATDSMQKSMLGLRIGMAHGDSILTRSLYQAFHIRLHSVRDIACEMVVA